MLIVDLIYNLSVLVALSVLSGFVDKHFRRETKSGKIIQGILFGAASVIAMLYPFVFTKGIIFDGRSIVIGLCTLFFGPVSGAISALMAAAYRIYIGGGGTITGLLVIFESFAFGLYFYKRRKLTPAFSLSNANLYLFGLLIHVCMILAMLALPSGNFMPVLSILTPTIIGVYPVVTLLIGKILQDQEENLILLERIKASEKKHKNMISNIADVIGIIDKNAVIKYKSPNIEKWFGWKPEDLIGISGWETVHPDDLEEIQKEFSALLGSENSSRQVEYRYKCKNGSYRFIQLTAVNLINDPSIEGILMNYHDITERKKNELQLVASETKYRALFEDAGDYIFVMKMDQESGPVIIDANNAAFEKHGYSRDELIGMPVINLEPPEFRNEALRRKIQSGAVGDSIVFETAHIRKDGSSFPVEVSARLVRIQEEEPYLISIERDISERKRNENELLQYRVHLEELVKSRTMELHKINEQLTSEIAKKAETEKLLNESLEKEKELNILKSRFISTASHEFRTPLTSMLSSAELLERLAGRLTEEKLMIHVNRIKKSVAYLSGLIEGILNVNKAEAGKIKLNVQPADLFEHCRNLLDEFAIHSDCRYSLKLSYNSGEKIFNLDIMQMDIIIRNLLSNACKFSRKGSDVILDVSTSQENIVLKVIDSGMGISEKEISNLFEPFYRSESAESIQGTGLGLTIVKNAIDLYKGRISIESRLNEGTVVKVEIPKNPAV